MEYMLVKSTKEDINRLIKYKQETIFEYADTLSNDEIKRINDYIHTSIHAEIDDYKNIVVSDKIVGALLVTDENDGVLLDEIYLEKDYRGKGIGSKILKDIIENHNTIYLWVYKENIGAISLYKRLGFLVIKETETRYYMKYKK